METKLERIVWKCTHPDMTNTGMTITVTIVNHMYAKYQSVSVHNIVYYTC